MAKKVYIGIDIGGSKMEGILWQGRILAHKTIKTPRNRKGFLEALIGLIGQMGPIEQVKGIGIGMAGAIDLKQGRVVRSPNIKFMNNFALTHFLQAKLKKQVRIDNDTKSFLRAENLFGQARGKKNVVALTLGTGLGGAVLVNGQMLRGTHLTAVELGHIIIAENSPSLPPPLFNQRGEDRRGVQRGGRGEFLTLEDLCSSHAFDHLKIKDPLYWQIQAEAGDKKAKKIYEQIGVYLGTGLASLVNIFDPELIVLGGGISKAYRLFLPRALKTMREYSLKSLIELPPVRISKLKHAGALGAVALFLE